MNEVKFPNQTPRILAILPKDTPEAVKNKIAIFKTAVALEKALSSREDLSLLHAREGGEPLSKNNTEFPSPQAFANKAHEQTIKKEYPELFKPKEIDSLTLITINNSLNADITHARLLDKNISDSNLDKIDAIRGTGYAAMMKEIIEKAVQEKINIYQSKPQNIQELDEMLDIFKAIQRSPLSLEQLAHNFLNKVTYKLFEKISEALEEVQP